MTNNIQLASVSTRPTQELRNDKGDIIGRAQHTVGRCLSGASWSNWCVAFADVDKTIRTVANLDIARDIATRLTFA